MKKRQALKILKNHQRYCYRYEQLYAAFHTACHMKNEHGVRARSFLTEQAFRNMVWSFTKDFHDLNKELQLNYGQSNMELAS